MTFRCTTCGAPAMAVAPGTADETCELLGTVLVMRRGLSARAWCRECWLAVFQKVVA